MTKLCQSPLNGLFSLVWVTYLDRTASTNTFIPIWTLWGDSFQLQLFWEMTKSTKLDIAWKPIGQFDSVKRFWSLRTSTVKRDIPIKRLRNGIFVKSNTKRFTEFTNYNLSQRLVELTLLFSMMLKSTSFLLTVRNRTSILGKEFSLQSLEFYSCI